MLVISDLHWRCDTPAWRKESDYAKQVLRLHTDLSIRDAGALDADSLAGIARDIAGLYDQLAKAYFS